jgi:hypothetical protein
MSTILREKSVEIGGSCVEDSTERELQSNYSISNNY